MLFETAAPVSLVMSAYNAGETIASALDSVVCQTFRSWVCVVVDDGSDDETHSIISEYASRDERILPIYLTANCGLPFCLNLAISATNTPLIARMDADDECLPDRLERQIDFMNANPSIGVLGGGAYYVSPRWDQPRLVLMPETHSGCMHRVYRTTPFIHPTVVFRRDVIASVGGYRQYDRCEDFDLWIRLSRLARFHNLQVPVLRYCWTQKGRSARDRLHRVWVAVKEGGLLYAPVQTLLGASLLCCPWRSGVPSRILFHGHGTSSWPVR